MQTASLRRPSISRFPAAAIRAGLEVDTGHLRVIFPDVGGEPPEFAQIRDIVLDILPCHLEVEFYFRYLTWDECERGMYTWDSVEAEGFTWDTFQMSPPAEA